MKIVDKKRTSAIAKAINVPTDLAEIIELCDGHRLLTLALIEWIFSAQEFYNYILYDKMVGAPRIAANLKACAQFPFCSVGIKVQCKCIVRMAACDDCDPELKFVIRHPADTIAMIITANQSQWLSQMPKADRETNGMLLRRLSKEIHRRACRLVVAEG
jgi:hypothetical protein